jgi:phosphate starvation-inducible protein PhoH and related proteins
LRKKNSKTKSRKTSSINATNDIGSESLHNIVGLRNRLKPRTANQKEFIRTVAENVITFCQGVAGSGKTHIAVGMALEYLFDNKVKKIIVTRPVVESGERIGFLPGTAEEKLHPYLLPILDEVLHFITISHYAKLKLDNKIEIVPLGLMRGRNFHDSFIIADECQNASYDQLKMLLTRTGNNSKMILTGDISQSDLSYHMRGGFLTLTNSLDNIEGIGISRLDNSDIIRNPIIGKILSRLEQIENEEAKR